MDKLKMRTKLVRLQFSRIQCLMHKTDNKFEYWIKYWKFSKSPKFFLYMSRNKAVNLTLMVL